MTNSVQRSAGPTVSVPPLQHHFDTLPASWRTLLEPFIQSPTYTRLCDFIAAEHAAGKTIYPSQIFRALHLTEASNVRVVILGQDPYHGSEHGQPQAHGLAFSVPQGIRVPPSLKNIFRELASSLGLVELLSPTQHGCLEAWARQGVLLLNTVLTVEAGKAGSHARHGWEACTDTLLAGLAREHEQKGLVFMLWGAHAQAKRMLLDTQRHTILEAPHPSPLSAHRGFLGCGHFLQANLALHSKGYSPIDWRLPSL